MGDKLLLCVGSAMMLEEKIYRMGRKIKEELISSLLKDTAGTQNEFSIYGQVNYNDTFRQSSCLTVHLLLSMNRIRRK